MTQIDMKGQTFGSLKVLGRSDRKSGAEWLWVCECECGILTLARGTKLRTEKRVRCAVCSGQAKSPPLPPKPPKEDCRMYDNDRCTALTEMLCRTRGECSFYKSKLENTAQE